MNHDDAVYLLGRPDILAITVFDTCLNIINLAMLPYLFIRMRTTKLMHRNLRAMMLSFIVAHIILNATSLWRSILYYLLAWYDELVTVGRPYSLQCWIVRAIFDTMMNVFGAVMISMAVERCVATWAMKSYELRESTAFALFLIFAQWLVASAAAVILTVNDFYSSGLWVEDGIQITCSMTFTHSLILMVLFVFGSVGFFVFTGVLVWLYRYNKMRMANRACGNTLTTRYQMAENVTTLRFLIPNVLVFGVFYVVSLAVVAYMRVRTRQEPISNELVRQLWFYEKLFVIPGSLNGPIFVALCLTLHLPLRTTFQEDFHWFFKEQPAKGPITTAKVVCVGSQQLNIPNESDVYFQMFESTWKANGDAVPSHQTEKNAKKNSKK